ncbi:MAG: hypothetical protein ACW99U_17890 [Candidatus Thorarchaeota archaeon]|jgi:N4-gp56 family major capsid protein
MAQFQGWADAPATGAYQSHEVVDVFRQAVANTLFFPRATRKAMRSGDEITIPIRGSLSRPSGTTALDEATSIPLDKLTITTKQIGLTERGRGVMVSKRAMNRSPIALLQEHQVALSEQLALDLDAIFCDAFQGGQLKYVATGAASYNLATGGTAGAAATNNPNFYHLRKMRDLAFRTYLMPKLAGGVYEFVVSTQGLRGILDDPEFLEINRFGNSEIFKKNMAGRISDVDIVENQHDDALDDDIGTSSDVGEGVFIAKDAVYYAMLEMPSIHWDRTHDHGRYTSLAWYGDYGVGTSTDSANAGLARLIHFTST